MKKKYDVVILGGGNAGFGASKVLATAGKKLAFVEPNEFGGTCPNRGCTPKKVLVAAAHSLDEISRASHHSIEVGPARLDWQALIQRKDEMIGFIPGAMRGVADKRGDVYVGQARFVGPNQVQVGEDTIEAEHILVATGSKPRPLSFPGSEHLVTSAEVLSSPTLPKKAVFIGGGVIALEFGHVYARAGVDVTILEVAPRLLPRLDADTVAQLHQYSESLGIKVFTGVKVQAIEGAGSALSVVYEHDGKSQRVDSDWVVNGAGRVANVSELDLAAAGVEHDGVRIAVNQQLQSVSNPSVWVAGDALVGSAQLSPIATYEGQVVGRNIAHNAAEAPDYFALPSAVFTVPSLATVGLTEEEAQKQYPKLRVTTNDMSTWFSGKSYGEKLAWAKVLIDDASDTIVGAHLLGHNADDLIHVFCLAMKHKISVTALKNQIFAFPSFSSDIKSLL